MDIVTKHGKTLMDFLHFEITQEEALEMEREDGFEAGFEKGVSQGLSQETAIGQERVNTLNKLLVESNRLEDSQESVVDPEYQKSLFEEFCL